VKNKSRFCNPSLFEMKSTKGFFQRKWFTFSLVISEFPKPITFFIS
jgi:hypothetical protein